MKPVFLDTVGLIAKWDRHDQWHASATAAFLELVRTRTPLVSTRFVLAECANSASRRPYRSEPNELRILMEAGNGLIKVDDDDWEQAWSDYRRGVGNNAGLVDCTSFVVMRRLGIQKVFSNDQHFRAAGFETLF